MPRARLRRATPRDIDVLVRHRRGMWAEILNATPHEMDAADRAYRRWLRPKLASGKVVGFVVEAGRGEVVASGCIWLMPSQPRPTWKGTVAPYLMSMYTEKAHRGQGYATQITREAVRWSRRQGYSVLLLHASRYGRPIYTRLGFAEGNEMRLRLVEGKRARRTRAARRT